MTFAPEQYSVHDDTGVGGEGGVHAEGGVRAEDGVRAEGGVHAEHRRTAVGAESPYIDAAVEVFSMLADPTRVRIVLILREGELPVGELAKRVDKTPTSVSQHLAKLRMARMVAARQEGTRVFYRLLDEHASELVVQALYQAEHVTDESFPPHAR